MQWSDRSSEFAPDCPSDSCESFISHKNSQPQQMGAIGYRNVEVVFTWLTSPYSLGISKYLLWKSFYENAKVDFIFHGTFSYSSLLSRVLSPNSPILPHTDRSSWGSISWLIGNFISTTSQSLDIVGAQSFIGKLMMKIMIITIVTICLHFLCVWHVRA